MDNIDNLIVEEGVIKEKIPEQVIPATEVVYDPADLRVKRAQLEGHKEELNAGIVEQQASMVNDQKQVADIDIEIGKIDAILAQVEK